MTTLLLPTPTIILPTDDCDCQSKNLTHLVLRSPYGYFNVGLVDRRAVDLFASFERSSDHAPAP